MTYEDILYDRDDTGTVTITINRPDKLNAFRDERAAVIGDVPKPVIAAVDACAIGGGHVLPVICDLTIAAAPAHSGEVGPEVGRVDAGFGTADPDRLVGQKKARETALGPAKASFNADTENIDGITALGMPGLGLYHDTEESAEGTAAFQEKRAPDFGRFRQ